LAEVIGDAEQGLIVSKNKLGGAAILCSPIDPRRE